LVAARLGTQTADLGQTICPFCLVEFKGIEYEGHCPGCRADGKKLPLMPVAVYLASVDFEFVEQFWRDNYRAGPDLRKRVLDRVGFLRERQRSEFGAALDQPLTRTPSDPRIKVLN
jgi:hypothetical protein